MMPVKDTVEKPIPASAPSASQPAATSKQETGGLRSDAVSLEVPVKVHGSRITEVVRDVTPHTEPFEEETSTMIVFPQGGVLKMSTAVSVGQMLVVTNLKSGQDAICRVLKVRAYANTQSYVEVEFTHRQAGYWGVQFSSDVVEAPKKPASLTVPRPPVPTATFEAPPPPQNQPIPLNKVPMTPTPVKASTEPVKAASPFVEIGSQEDVQASATPTAARPSVVAPMAPANVKARGVEPPKQSAPPVSPVASPSVAELRGDAQSAPETVDNDEPVLILEDSESRAVETSPAPSAAPAFRTFDSSANPAGKRTAAREMFGVSLEPEKAVAEGENSRNLMLIAVAVLLLVAAAGGYFFFHQHAAVPVEQVALPSTQEVTPPSPAPSVAAQAQPAAPVSTGRSAPAPRLAAAPAPTPARVREEAPVETKQAARNEAPAPAPPEAQPGAEARRPSGNMPSLFGALNAHPVASHSAARENEAPAIPIGAPAVAPESLAVIAQPAAGLPAPPTATKAPRLISSVLPVYPDFARQRGIDGTVVIQATVEANGTIGTTKVLSGPQSLREAALHALRQWKYEPGKIDGQTAPVDITVTLHFNGK